MAQGGTTVRQKEQDGQRAAFISARAKDQRLVQIRQEIPERLPHEDEEEPALEQAADGISGNSEWNQYQEDATDSFPDDSADQEERKRGLMSQAEYGSKGREGGIRSNRAARRTGSADSKEENEATLKANKGRARHEQAEQNEAAQKELEGMTLRERAAHLQKQRAASAEISAAEPKIAQQINNFFISVAGPPTFYVATLLWFNLCYFWGILTEGKQNKFIPAFTYKNIQELSMLDGILPKSGLPFILLLTDLLLCLIFVGFVYLLIVLVQAAVEAAEPLGSWAGV
ncbi:hypothetical protein HYV73_02950 [Candidatus Uhrbacteria bacterium]|nr:hypothetical protein [Candidatus Uhrbacteria bacterium]